MPPLSHSERGARGARRLVHGADYISGVHRVHQPLTATNFPGNTVQGLNLFRFAGSSPGEPRIPHMAEVAVPKASTFRSARRDEDRFGMIVNMQKNLAGLIYGAPRAPSIAAGSLGAGRLFCGPDIHLL